MLINNKAKKKELALLLKDALEQSGMSQRDLAKKMGKYQNTIYRILSGKKHISVLELLDFCSICGISWKEILSAIEKPHNSTN